MTDNQILPQKPKNTMLAIRILWGSLALVVLSSALNWNFSISQIPPDFPMDKNLFILIVLMFTFTITIWLIFKISSGRNWARIVWLTMFIIGMPMGVPHVIAIFNHSKLLFLISVTQWVFQFVALCLLFSGPGASWFKEVKTLRYFDKTSKREARTRLTQQRILQRPKSVIFATSLLWITQIICISLAIVFLYIFIGAWNEMTLATPNKITSSSPLDYPNTELIVFSLLLPLIGLTFLHSWMILKISSGSNGARIIFLFVCALSIFCFIPGLLELFSHFNALNAISPIIIIFECIALYLLFINPGAAWFNDLKQTTYEVK